MSFEPYKSAKVVLIRSLSDLHPGTGRGGEVVDLAVQRDGVGFPVIYGSSIKGSMKTALYHRNKSLTRLLGPEPESDEKYSSPVAVMTAYILSFPVRSLKGIYTNVTSPFLLRRFAGYLHMASVLNAKYSEIERDVRGIAEISGKFPATTGFKNKHVVEGLEKASLCEEVFIDRDSIEERSEMDKLRDLLGLDKSESLISIDDDRAKSLVERSLMRVTRIRIERDKKTVAEGGLWTEEAVPSGTIFATVFLGYSKEKCMEVLRKSIKEKGEIEELERYLGNKELIDAMLEGAEYLIMGGDETVGRGIVELRKLGEVKQ
jgi:CRISPR-associated protein Cmr4